MDHPIHESGPHLARILESHLEGEGPIYRQLAAALRHAVDSGELPLGTVLPPERALARALAVSRSTVVAAYDTLKSEGWLMSRQGSGTWVREPEQGDDETTATSRLFLGGSAEREPPGAGDVGADGDGDLVELTVAAPRGNDLIVETLRDLDSVALERLMAGHGYVPGGLLELRDAVAGRLTALGLPTVSEQVLITTGAHQGIAVVARHTVHAGDSVLCESPTFPGALDLLRSLAARLVPVPIDADGARTDVLADLVSRTSPHLLYVTPTFHNPTGTVMPPERREQLAGVAASARIPVVENLSVVDLHLSGPTPPPPIAAYEPAAPIFTVGSMSKLFWGGLRIGWVRGPEPAIGRLLGTKTVADLGSPLISQLLAARLLGRIDEMLQRRREELIPRRDHLCRLLRERLPAWEWRTPDGGLSLWVHLPYGNAEEFAELAARQGAVVVPGPALSVDEGNRRALRLVFALPEDELERGVRRLAAAWERYAPTGARAVSRLLV